MIPTTLRVRELFNYLPETGELIWKISQAPRAIVGSVAGYARSDNRIFVCVDSKKYRAHRIVWLWHGRQLPQRLDHINRNPLDNRIENLRVCTNAENGWNAKKSKANVSGIKGVNWNGLNKNWRVKLMVHGKYVEVGSFDDLELAELISVEARVKYHGAFATSINLT